MLKRTLTACSPQGRSARVRSLWLRSRLYCLLQTGQLIILWRVFRVTVKASWGAQGSKFRGVLGSYPATSTIAG